MIMRLLHNKILVISHQDFLGAHGDRFLRPTGQILYQHSDHDYLFHGDSLALPTPAFLIAEAWTGVTEVEAESGRMQAFAPGQLRLIEL
jgi:hypothetical protein